MFLNEELTQDEISSMYPASYYLARRDLGSRIIRLLSRGGARDISRARKSGRILDVGCGDGQFLSQFRRRDWETFGVDISATACNIAAERLHGNIFNRRLTDCSFPDRYFDVITFNHVLEHIKDQDETLKEARRILRDDGLLFVSVPDISSSQFKASGKYWMHLDLPRHFYHYSPKTIELVLNKNGFRISSMKRPLSPFPLDIYYSLKLKFLNGNPNALKSVASGGFLFATAFKLVPSWRASIEIFAQKR